MIRRNIANSVDECRNQCDTSCVPTVELMMQLRGTKALNIILLLRRQSVCEEFVYSFEQNHMTKLKIEDGSVFSSKVESLRELERFYGQLYNSTQMPTVFIAQDRA